MKNIICLTVAAFGLGACAMLDIDANMESSTPEIVQPTLEDIATEAEQDLADKRDVIGTLNFFNNVHDGIQTMQPRKVICVSNGLDGPSIKKYTLLMSKTAQDFPFEKNCLISSYHCNPGSAIQYIDNSDECILARRDAPESIISYYNFKKYFPEESKIKTEKEFADVYALFKVAYLHHGFPWGWQDDAFVKTYAERNCYKTLEQTQAEKDQCVEEEKQFIRDLVLGKAVACSKKYPTKYSKLKKELKNTHYVYATKDSGDAEQETKFGAINLCVPDKIHLATY